MGEIWSLLSCRESEISIIFPTSANDRLSLIPFAVSVHRNGNPSSNPHHPQPKPLQRSLQSLVLFTVPLPIWKGRVQLMKPSGERSLSFPPDLVGHTDHRLYRWLPRNLPTFWPQSGVSDEWLFVGWTI
jgi:hypothetical protein